MYRLDRGQAAGGAVGCGTALQAGRSRVRLPIVSLEFFIYTGCNRRKGPEFGRVFLMLNYTEKPQNTYIQS